MRCGPCRRNDLLAGGTGRAELLGYIAIELETDAVLWVRWERLGANTVARRRGEYLALAPPGVVGSPHEPNFARVGPVLFDLDVPSEGLRLRCRRGRHRLKIMKEAELRELIRRLPISASVLYLPAA